MGGKTILITGVSGYIGGALCRQLEHIDWCGRVHGCDIRAPLDKLDKVTYREISGIPKHSGRRRDFASS